MLIKEISIADGDFGLQHSKMTRLERVVLLSGPNGGGKSRILRAVAARCAHYPFKRDYENALQERAEIKEHIESNNGILLQVGDARYENTARREIENSERQLVAANSTIMRHESLVFSEELTQKPTVVHYTTKVVDFLDWRDQTYNTARQIFRESAGQVNFQSVSNNVVSIIHEVCRSHFITAGAPNVPEEALRLAKERYERLCASILAFLGVELDCDPVTQGPMLFGHPLFEAGLSEGQKILLVAATSLALQDGSSDKLILLLDEPEKHLHPKALLELLDRLDKACPHAQLWIATHSIHVLAHYGEKCIWSVRDGKAQHAGRQWTSVLESLIGSPEHSDNVRSFLGLPAEHAMLSFAAECLIPPAIVDTSPGDPQTSQIADFLKGVRTPGKPMRLLDFGAGQGRLLGELMEQSVQFREDFDYFAFDQPDVKREYKERCLSRLRECYSDGGDKHYLLGGGAIRNAIDSNTVDCVILCNVLHELDPKDWISLLGRTSDIYECLSDQGVLLIVEDQLLRDGERAHSYNFLVLGEHELKTLFGVAPENESIVSLSHPKYPDRLKMHRVPKSLLANLSATTRTQALKKLVANAKDRANALSGSMDAMSGRLYGFWTMQHFNATAALEHWSA